jgi:hypothetical protein
MTVFEVDAKTRIWKHFGNHALHFKEFFFGHYVFQYKGLRPEQSAAT